MTDVISKIATPNGTQTIGGDQFDGQWVRSSLEVYNGSINASDTKTIDLSEWLPDITNRYEIILQLQANSGTTSGNLITLQLTSQQSGSSYMADFGGVNRSSSYEMVGGMANLVINANNPYFRIANTGNATVTGIVVYVLYYRVLGWNEHSTASQNQIEKIKIPDGTTIPFGGDNFDGQWQSYNGTSAITPLSSATINANSDTSVDISSYIPNDGYAYELLIRAIARTSTTSGNNILLRIGVYSSGNNNLIIRGTTRSNAYRQYSGNCVLPITAAQRTLYIQNTGNAAATAVTVYITAYKRIGKNVTGGNYLTNIKTPDGTVIPFRGKNTNGQWSYKTLTVLNNITFNDTATTNHDYTVTNYLPTNDEWYEILINTVGSTGTTSGNNVNWTLYCNPTPTATNLQQGTYTNTRTSSAQSLRLNGIIIGKQDSNGDLVVRVRNFTTVKTGGNYIRFRGYRRLGTNE